MRRCEYDSVESIGACGAIAMAEWVKREYGKGAINRAGKVLLEWWITPGDSMDLESWSSAYSYG